MQTHCCACTQDGVDGHGVAGWPGRGAQRPHATTAQQAPLLQLRGQGSGLQAGRAPLTGAWMGPSAGQGAARSQPGCLDHRQDSSKVCQQAGFTTKNTSNKVHWMEEQS